MTSSDISTWLTIVSQLSLVLAAVCCVWIVFDLMAGHKQHMWIMNLVWPITALWAGPLALWAYYRIGRTATHQQMLPADQRGQMPAGRRRPFWQSVAVSTTHCGSGCTVGDICAEWFLFFFPAITLLGSTFHFRLFGREMFAAWVVDYVLALLFGIAFQYFTIKPMRNLSVGRGLIEAVKADAISLTAWQVGMYGWMAIAVFLIFGQPLAKTNPVFWFMMQIAMCAGFVTSYPVNWWLLTSGIKEEM